MLKYKKLFDLFKIKCDPMCCFNFVKHKQKIILISFQVFILHLHVTWILTGTNLWIEFNFRAPSICVNMWYNFYFYKKTTNLFILGKSGRIQFSEFNNSDIWERAFGTDWKIMHIFIISSVLLVLQHMM